MVSRNIPTEVKRELRKEVGFGCPIKDCNSPFLEYHHFDPEFHVEPHHRPEGMIALCPTHHGRAKEFSREYLRELKKISQGREIRDKFYWIRRKMIAVVGGNYYIEAPDIIVYRDQPIVWYRRDEKGAMLFGFNMISDSGEPRASMNDNDWCIVGEPDDVICGPVKPRLKVSYPNGDMIDVLFKEWDTPESLFEKHPLLLKERGYLDFPVSTIEISMSVGGEKVLGPRETRFGGIRMTGCTYIGCGFKFAIGEDGSSLLGIV